MRPQRVTRQEPRRNVETKSLEFAASGRVAEDRCDGALAGNVVATDGEYVSAVQPDAPGDLVDDAVVDRVVGVVECHGAGVLLESAGDDLVDVDEHGVDEAVSGGARDIGDVGRRTSLRGPERVSLVNGTQL